MRAVVRAAVRMAVRAAVRMTVRVAVRAAVRAVCYVMLCEFRIPQGQHVRMAVRRCHVVTPGKRDGERSVCTQQKSLCAYNTPPP